MNKPVNSKAQQGFTLIEIVIAIAILALLATTVAPMVMKHMEDAKVAKMIQAVDAIEAACLQHHIDTNAYAHEYTGYTEAQHHGLAMDSGVDGWDGPYLDKVLSASQNPWGSTIHMYASLNSHTANGYDLYGTGSVTHSGNGNSLIVWGVSEENAEKVDEKLDGDLPGDWMTTGRVEYQNNRLCIFIYQ